MECVTDVSVCHRLENSQYVKPIRVFYTQNGVKKQWDLIQSHDSVAVLVHNITRDVFVFVRQFRPAVYVSHAKKILGSDLTEIDTKVLPPATGCTIELCAGIVDKNASVEEIACAEIEEECGYSIPKEDLLMITVCSNGVGISGSRQTLFYAPVTDAMKISDGGGNPDEGELIEIVEIPVSQSLDLITDTTRERPPGFLFALLWFQVYKKVKE